MIVYCVGDCVKTILDATTIQSPNDNKCIQNVYKMYTKCIQNVRIHTYKIQLEEITNEIIQTKNRSIFCLSSSTSLHSIYMNNIFRI